jgi:MYXO-CTERM domain-containing protein
MAQPGSALLIVVLGILLALVSLFADPLGVGGQPGFGWKQIVGLLAGVGLVAFGLWRRR